MLTKKQLKVFDFISKFIFDHRYAPTLRQIMDGCELHSTYIAHTYVRRIVDRGFLKKIANTAAGLEIIKYPLGAIVPSTQVAVTLTETDDVVRAAYARGVRAGKALFEAGNETELARAAYAKGLAAGKAKRLPKNLADAYERGLRQGKSEATRELNAAYRHGYDAATAELTKPRFNLAEQVKTLGADSLMPPLRHLPKRA